MCPTSRETQSDIASWGLSIYHKPRARAAQRVSVQFVIFRSSVKRFLARGIPRGKRTKSEIPETSSEKKLTRPAVDKVV